ncbi:hypothetical protein E8E14_012218 [Neopestalotiopsis sp. 37M]|nr:hypothetical protein E8E14_012218 [Neopestalotiopsis sp. 37M]
MPLHPRPGGSWSLRDTYASSLLSASTTEQRNGSSPVTAPHTIHRDFHNYFVTHLPSSSLHPDSRSAPGLHHKLPRDAAAPHVPGPGSAVAVAPPHIPTTRELTVVRIPLRSAKHHFGAAESRGQRPYNEDTNQAGTIDMPAFAKRAPISLVRSKMKKSGEGTSADSAFGDPQIFYFAVFDGHGGNQCSDFLKAELHGYIEEAATEFELKSSLKAHRTPGPAGAPKQVLPTPILADSEAGGERGLDKIEMKDASQVKHKVEIPITKNGEIEEVEKAGSIDGSKPKPVPANQSKALRLQKELLQEYKELVGGYFRRCSPEHFSLQHDPESPEPPVTIESVLTYAFLRADLDFISAQARKPDPDDPYVSDTALNKDDVLGSPSHMPPSGHGIGGKSRFKGGSTASVAMISTPTPAPFWHPAASSTLLVGHVGDTRILLCETATGLAKPLTSDHHPNSPIESHRLRRFAASFVTDSFGEERIQGLANSRAFGDIASKRLGVSAEPEITRAELGPAQYSFLVLMSDGVSGTLSDQEIVDVVKEAKTPEQGARDVVSYSTEVTVDGDNKTSPLPLPEQMGKSTESHQALGQIKQWITTCITGHPDCERKGASTKVLPTRLLDLGSETSAWPPKRIRIITSKTLRDAVDSERRYVTLSHCWGPSPSFAQLNQDNLEEWMTTGIPWAECCSNKNFEEALHVARNLGVRYIWIDSLCIIQHNEEDWKGEAPMMRDIYRNSFCNIAASDSADGYGGLFRARDGADVAAPVYSGRVGTSIPLLAGRTWRIVSGSMWKRELLGQPLYKRGWVFQERMLAPRILHFCRSQVFWDCATASACETFPEGLPAQLDGSARIDRRWRAWLGAPTPEARGNMNVDTFWSAAVSAYTGNDLTFHKDKLSAVQGVGNIVAEAMHEAWGDWHAGLWSTRLENQLAWTVVDPAEASRPVSQAGEVLKFPSWSWTSIQGQVRTAQLWAPLTIYSVENHTGEGVAFTSMVENAKGDLASRDVLSLRCHVGHGVLKQQQKHDRLILEVGGASNDDDSYIQVFPDTLIQMDTKLQFLILFVSREPAKLRTADGYEILRIIDEDDPETEFTYSGLGLLIEPVASKPGYYVRLGVIKFSELNEQDWRQVRGACNEPSDGKGCDGFTSSSASASSIWLM